MVVVPERTGSTPLGSGSCRNQEDFYRPSGFERNSARFDENMCAVTAATSSNTPVRASRRQIRDGSQPSAPPGRSCAAAAQSRRRPAVPNKQGARLIDQVLTNRRRSATDPWLKGHAQLRPAAQSQRTFDRKECRNRQHAVAAYGQPDRPAGMTCRREQADQNRQTQAGVIDQPTDRNPRKLTNEMREEAAPATKRSHCRFSTSWSVRTWLAQPAINRTGMRAQNCRTLPTSHRFAQIGIIVTQS